MNNYFTTKAWRKCCAFAFCFFYISLFSHAISVSSEFFHIYSDKSGTSFFANAKIQESLLFESSSIQFDANYTNVYSSLANVSFKTNAFDFGASLKTEAVDFNTKLFFMQTDNLLVSLNEKDFKIKKITSFDFSFSMALNFPSITNVNLKIEPFFTFGSLHGKTGDLHYFYAEPRLPLLYILGCNCSVDNLKLSVLYSSFDLSLYAYPLVKDDNNFDKLAQTNNYIFGVISKYDFLLNRFTVSPTAGFFHLDIKGSGALTSQNQKYLFFPYKTFNFSGDINVDAIIFGVNTKYNKNFFTLAIDFETLFCVNQTLSYEVDYVYKKNFLFDGSKDNFSGEFNNLKGNGIGLLTLSTDFKIPVKKSTFLINAKKTFLIPLFFNTSWLEADENTDTSESKINFGDNFWLYYLLSGTSLSLQLTL